MTKSKQKITLSESRGIPFNKLVLSQMNVRRIKANVSIEELAEDIARRTLLQSLTVRPVFDDGGNETGMFEVPAGGRRYRALELLVKQKRLARNAAVPCVVRTHGLAEEDSLAENVQRAPLHPLDQFRAFQTLREKGQTEEEIAAAFFVSASAVRQRLRLAAVSPKLLDLYAEDEMTLDQLMAFTVNPDHERQEQVWEAIQRSYTRQPYEIRRMLTEGAVRMTDKRAQLVGIEAYEEAGGVILRDLFHPEDDGWLQDAALLDRLAVEKLDREAEAIRAEGWKWVEVALGFPYGHNYGLRRIAGEAAPMTAEEEDALQALKAELDQLEEEYAGLEELPEDIDERIGELETAIAAFEDRPLVFDVDDKACAGAVVCIDGNGAIRVERGYVRPEDEMPVASSGDADAGTDDGPAIDGNKAGDGDNPGDPISATECADHDEGSGQRPLPDGLVAELTAHRTVALRNAVANHPETAFAAALHAFCLAAFYRYSQDTCLELHVTSTVFGSRAPGLEDTIYAAAVETRHAEWASRLPSDPGDLWDAILALQLDDRHALFAHCVSLSINAVRDRYDARPKAIGHANQLARAVGLDMTALGWAPTAGNYLGRITKARILDAVREAKGMAVSQMIDHLKKPDMAQAAEDALAGTGWLPEPLRTPGVDTDDGSATSDDEAEDGSFPRVAAAE